MNANLDSTKLRRDPDDRLPTGRMELTERDRALLVDLYLHRAMTRSQIQSLGYFGSVPRANQRLRLLFDHGLLRRLRPRQCEGGQELVHGIGTKAVSIVAGLTNEEASGVRSSAAGSLRLSHLAHILSIVDLRIAFNKASKVTTWLPECRCRHEYAIRQLGGDWQNHVLRPDAFISCQLAEDGRELHAFLEADLGNTSLPRWSLRFASYRQYHQLGLFRETFGLNRFALLIVTTGQARAKAILQRGSELPFRVATTTWSGLRELGIAAPIWSSQTATKQLLLSILGDQR